MTREDVQRAAAAGAALQVPAGAIVTDLAREEAASQGVTILAGAGSAAPRTARAPPAAQRAPEPERPRSRVAPAPRSPPSTAATRTTSPARRPR